MSVTHLLASLLLSQTWMLVAWLGYQKKQNAMLADVVWGLGITALAWFHSLSFHGLHPQIFLYLALVSLWGLRLSAYLFWTRLHRKKQDPRYQTLSEQGRSMFWNYQLQGILQNLIALPWLFITPQWQGASVIAIIGFFLGFTIECAADYQLYRFKQEQHPGVCRVGLWAYSRHPNYFGECLIWLSFAVLAHQAIAWISPLSLYLIMRYLTAPLTEAQSLQSKGKLYQDYQASVPMIIPKFWR